MDTYIPDNSPGQRFKFHALRVKQHAASLFDMMYSANELAEHFETTRRIIVDRWIKAGLPHTKDEHGRYWFNGRDVAAWVNTFKPARESDSHAPLDKIWCMNCRQYVKPKEPRQEQNKRMLYIHANCPKCGGHISKSAGSKGAAW